MVLCKNLMKDVAEVRKLILGELAQLHGSPNKSLDYKQVDWLIGKVRGLEDYDNEIRFQEAINTLFHVADCFEGPNVRADCLRLLDQARMELAEDFFQNALNGKRSCGD
jgi:hypothetical protein